MWHPVWFTKLDRSMAPTTTPPTATYRLQFHASFTFEAAASISGYLHDLGVSHCYASSYFKAVPGSLHGYDVVDPTQLNPEIGDEQTYERWVDELRSRGMGHIIDLVPNHMGTARSANPWWQDVLENGPSSRYAAVFDIDWHPLNPQLENKVLLPVLSDSYGAALERQHMTLEYHAGAFRIRCFDHVLPVAPGAYDLVLGVNADTLLNAIGADSEDGIELLSILTAIRHLPNRQSHEPALVAERDREKEVIKRRLAALTARSSAVLEHLERTVQSFNGVRGDACSFDKLDELLSAQAYRLAYWRVAAEEINYRRFFDINELAAIRMEDPAVFERTHAFAFDLLKRGRVDGFRIDHVDGLYDPGDYLHRLQARARELCPDRADRPRPAYLIVEKILGADEPLPPWPVEGTTGYDFLTTVNGLFVDRRNERAINDIYERFTRMRVGYREIAYRGKQVILRMSMASELNVLAHGLSRFAERNRHYRDFTLNSLVYAMREIIACFPVYRTYVTDHEPVSERDRSYIEHAVLEAKRRNPGRPPLVFDFVRDLLLKQADYIPEGEHDEHMKFVGKFQQVTSPVTAKGIEDTALYIYNRLVSLNEVGGEPDRFGTDPEALHQWLTDRARRWPHGLSATSTHDTKRSEDVRARLNVLSELPGAWKQALSRWARANRRARSTIDGESYPSRNEEYLLYQTLVGSWPLEPMSPDEERDYGDRVRTYMLKAMREAKVFTTWLNPSERHERAMAHFVDTILAPDNAAFREDFLAFQRRVAQYGIYNSLSQLTIKIGSPGVPDLYQGTELWDFSLVDPDNRRPVDYGLRRRLLGELDEASMGADGVALTSRLLGAPCDNRLKLYATATMLRFRRERRQLFQCGEYHALAVEGSRRDHLFGFARSHGPHHVLILLPRLIASLLPDPAIPPLGERVWNDTVVMLPKGAAARYRQIFTGRCVAARADGGPPSLRAADVFEHFPIAFLEST
jgi:(1->4)-alpha-D-glucan 1-alpha-D-glucosylmutase